MNFATTALALLGAAGGAYLLYWAGKAVQKRIIRQSVGGSFDAFLGETSPASGLQAQVGEHIARNLPFSTDFIADDLTWAQRDGKYLSESAASILFQATLGALAGGAYLLLFGPSLAGFLAPFVGAALPVVRLHEAAEAARSRLRDSVATIAIMISAEMSAGASAEQAIQRAADLPGLLGSFLSDAVELSRSGGRPLIKRGNMPGTFSDVCAKSGVRELRVLASQLDLVADVGVDAADRMAEVAKSVLSEQKNAINDKVQQLEDKLAVMVGLFFFAPSWFALLGVIFFQSMNSF